LGWVLLFHKKEKERREKTMKICNGGRIKAAAVGLNYLLAKSDPVELEKYLRELRKNPPQELLKTFFPSDERRLKQLLSGVGFYRPFLKTEQGMGGNFLPFWIDREISQTDLSVRMISSDELVAIPEKWYPHKLEMVLEEVQEKFYQGDFMGVYKILEGLGSRTAEKGRNPFFFIRPAITDRPIVFGNDLVMRVEQEVGRIIEEILEEAVKLERETMGFSRSSNLIYCQPDVYILRNGQVTVEKINIPDVGLFLKHISHPQSKILPQIQEIVSRLEEEVCDTIVRTVPSDFLVLLTRTPVILNKEDLLEILEIETIASGLAQRGIRTEVRGVHEVGLISTHTHVLLMNLDYRDKEIETLFKRHARGEIVCYPNPFVQIMSRKKTGLKVHPIPKRYEEKFLQLIKGVPKNEEGERKIREQIERRLLANNIQSNILHAQILHRGFELETVPVFRPVLHSWRQLGRRADRDNQRGEILLKEVPANFDTLLISSKTGPRLDVFRFMFVRE
jgi:hypothetical protein